MKQGFPKTEKLKQKKQISMLFEQGKWKTCDQLRIVSVTPTELDGHKIGVSVSKRFFKKAVHRNRIKRLLREAYRLNKAAYIEKFGDHSLAMLFWVSPRLPKNYHEVELNFLKLCQSTK